jgi:hypothetical protein
MERVEALQRLDGHRSDRKRPRAGLNDDGVGLMPCGVVVGSVYSEAVWLLRGQCARFVFVNLPR